MSLWCCKVPQVAVDVEQSVEHDTSTEQNLVPIIDTVFTASKHFLLSMLGVMRFKLFQRYRMVFTNWFAMRQAFVIGYL